jgi:DNA-binding transcriptional LysR family regulator
LFINCKFNSSHPDTAFSVTRQIKDLEEELDVLLLNRTKRQVSLTDGGRSFLIDAKRLLYLAREMVESVQRLKSGGVSALIASDVVI